MNMFYTTFLLFIKHYQLSRAIKNNATNWKEEKMHFFLGSLHYVINCFMWYVRPFLNKSSLSKSFCSLRLGFQRTICDAPKLFLVLVFFGTFEMTAHLKLWLMLRQRCFNGSELLVGLLCSFHLTSALRLVSPM